VNISRWPNQKADEAEDSPNTCCVPNREIEEAIQQLPAVEIPASSNAYPREGDKFAGFRIIGELGRGAFGRVFLAEQLDLAQRRVALKVSLELNGESQKLAQLQHTNIMPIYSAHKVGTFQVVCMPYYGATTLAQIIQGLRAAAGKLPKSGRVFLSTIFSRSDSRRYHSDADSGHGHGSTLHGAGAMTLHDCPASTTPITGKSVEELDKLARMTHVEAALWITARVADGLAHAHSRNIMHRDLKPANILLTDEGQPMLLDFNLATSSSPQTFNRYRNGGTLPYMSPEQLASLTGQKYCPDQRSDLYSLGVILYELLTGRHPFRLPKGKVAEAAPAMIQDRLKTRIDPKRYNPLTTPAITAIIQKLLAPNPDHRYQSASEVQEDLDRQLENRPLKFAREVSVRERVEKFRKRNPRLWTGALVTLASSVLVLLPLTLQTVKQFEIAERRRETQRAEAVLLFKDTQKQSLAAQMNLFSRSESVQTRANGMRIVEEMARQYGVERSNAWLNSPKVQQLSETQRMELLSTLGQTMWIMSESCRQHANDVQQPAMREQADHWRQLALQCFQNAGRHAFVDRENTKVDHVDLAKVDDADLYSLASDAVTVGKYRDGLRLLKELTQRDPSHFLAWFMRGLCHEGLGQDWFAAEAWTVCIALQPDFAKAYYNRGIVRVRLRDFDAAHGDFTRAVERDSNFVLARINQGLASIWLKKHERAEQELTQAIKIDPESSRAFLLRAKARRALNRLDLASADESKGLSRTPTDDIGWTTRGFERMDKQPKEALADFSEALALNPRNRDALINRVHVLHTYESQYDTALTACEQLLDCYPEHLGAHASRGVLLARLGRIEDAVKEAEYCLALDQSAFNVYQIGSLYAQISKHSVEMKTKAIDLLRTSLKKGLSKPQ